MQEDLKVWHCDACAEAQMDLAKQKMAARNLRAQEKGRQQKHLRQYVAGWMPTPCDHEQCEPRTVAQEHYDALHEIERPVQRTPSDEAASFRAVAQRLSAAESAPEHVRAAEEYDRQKADREARDAAESARQAVLRREESMASSAARQRAMWSKNVAEGRIPIHRPLGRPYSREMHDNLMAGREPYVPFEMLAGFHDNSVRSAMDVFSWGITGKDRMIQAFLRLIRRTEMGLSVDWVLPDNFEPDIHRRFEINKRNAPFIHDGEGTDNDLPLDWYDSGDSEEWKKKQKLAAWQQRERKGQNRAKTSLGDLLKGIGK